MSKVQIGLTLEMLVRLMFVFLITKRLKSMFSGRQLLN